MEKTLLWICPVLRLQPLLGVRAVRTQAQEVTQRVMVRSEATAQEAAQHTGVRVNVEATQGERAIVVVAHTKAQEATQTMVGVWRMQSLCSQQAVASEAVLAVSSTENWAACG